MNNHLVQQARNIMQQTTLTTTQLENVIMAVPKSEARNLLTEANILQHEARKKIRDALTAEGWPD